MTLPPRPRCRFDLPAWLPSWPSPSVRFSPNPHHEWSKPLNEISGMPVVRGIDIEGPPDKPSLMRTVTVLHRAPYMEGPATVYLGADAEDGRATSIRLDRDVWNDMGQPRVVTVTIEPGDQLNDPTTIDSEVSDGQ